MAQGTCSIDGCWNEVLARGFCNAHYHRWWRHGDPLGSARPNVNQRFWAKVEKTDLCWLWRGARTSWGYGQIRIDGHCVMAHRWAYEARFGPIPDGLQIDHLCRNPPCVNPDHLEVVTRRENALRGFQSTMPRKTCGKGHLLNSDNLKRLGDRMICRTCAIERSRQWRERQRDGPRRQRS